MTARLARWWPVLLLGLAIIGAYGTAYYSIGVLIPVIGEATGWSTSALAAGFSLGLLGTGGMACLPGVPSTIGALVWQRSAGSHRQMHTEAHAAIRDARA